MLSLSWEFHSDLLFPWEKQKCLHATHVISELGQRSGPWSHPQSHLRGSPNLMSHFLPVPARVSRGDPSSLRVQGGSHAVTRSQQISGTHWELASSDFELLLLYSIW